MPAPDPATPPAPPAPAPTTAPPNVGTVAGSGGIGVLVGALAGSSAASHDITPWIKAAEWALEKGLGPLLIAVGLVVVVQKLYASREAMVDLWRSEVDARRNDAVSFLRDQLTQANAANKLLAAIEPLLARVERLLEHDKDVLPEVREIQAEVKGAHEKVALLLERIKGGHA